MKLQKLGGYALIASVSVFYILVVFSILRLKPFGDLSDPVKAMAARSAAPADFYVLYWLFALCYILWLIGVFALYERMKTDVPYLTRIALIAASAGTAMGITYAIVLTKGIGMLVPTQDVSAYRALDVMAAGLNSMGGHAYGWVCLLIGYAVLKTRAFSKVPGWLFLLTGIWWIPTCIYIPGGLEFTRPIPWVLCNLSLVWFGIGLIRKEQPQPVPKEMAAVK